MDMLQDGIGKEAFGTVSDVSFASSASTQVKKPSATGRNMQLDPIFKFPKNSGHRKVKFMSSSAGKILPRPSDLKLRYVGGETRMISVSRYIQYAAFFTKMVELYGPDIVVKYQLPEEDLDALVSVSSDEDLENMMEECDKLNTSEGSSRLRVFIFPSSESDLPDLEHMDDHKTTEQKFVDALNAIVSADTIPGVHNLSAKAKQHTTSDSFNDAYKAWNGIQSQDKGSMYLKDLQEENSGITGNMYGLVHASAAISPFSFSHFMGQPAFSNAFSAPDVFGNDLELSNVNASSSFFQHGVGGENTENDQPSRPDIQLLKELTLKDRVQHTAQVAEQSVAMEGILDVKESLVEDPLRGTGSIDDFRDSHANALHQSFLHLSPGGFLQKQLLSTSAEAFHYTGKVLDSKYLEVDDVQTYSVNSSVRPQEDQEQASHQGNRLQSHYQWEAVDSPGLERENEAFEHINWSSVCAGMVNPLEAPLHPKEGLSTMFSASSGPSSPLGMNVQNDRRLDFNYSEASETTGVSSLDGAVPGDSSAFATNTCIESNVQVKSSGIPSHTTKQDSSHMMPCITSEESSYPHARLDKSIQLEGMSQINFQAPAVGKHSQIHSYAPPEITKHPRDLLQNEDMGALLPFFGTLHTSGPLVSDETAPSGQRVDGLAVLQNEDEHADRLSGHSDSRLGGAADVPTLDMLSGLLESCQVTECLPALSSKAESPKSRSLCSLGEAPLPQESGNLTARVGRESLLTAVQGLDFPLPTERQYDHSSFHTMQESLPVYDEQLDNTMPSPDFNTFNGTRHFPEDSVFENREGPAMSTSEQSRVSALTSLIETWEASLLQDEDEQHTVMYQRVEEDTNSTPVYDKEEYRVEIEEVEEFESYDYNAAAVAEQEAIARGLQIIRNCDLEELRELGSGTFGTVYHGKWRGTDVAIKRIKASCFAGRQAERDRLVADFWREAYILGQLHHPNVVAFYGVVPDGPGGTLATVTEYMVNGSLKQVLQNKDRTLDRRKRLLIAMDAAFGMEYLHGKNVVHFDIKCENLLVNLKDPQRPICKVGDLGLSKVKQQTFVSGGVRGTLPWMAPELLNGSSSLVSEKVDVFSFGIVMWELLTGEEPYANMHYGAIIGGIVNNTLRPTVPRWCDPAWRSLMERCWAADPADRPTFLEIARTLRAMEASISAIGPGQARILEMYQ